MSGGTLAWGIAFAVLCVLTGISIGCPIAYAYGRKRAAEDAEDARSAAVIDEWKGLPDEDARPEPPWPDAPPQAPRGGPGKHRHPAGPRHAELPVAGRLPAPEPDRWGGTITVPAPLPAPVQTPPWEQPEPEPPTQVLEPTAVLPPDSLTDTAWTRRMAADMDAWIAEHIGATDSTLKAITK